jgi:hypothetical protein
MATPTFYANVLAQNPWLATFGVTPQRIQELLATASGDAEMFTMLTNEPQVRQRFAGLYRQDGSTRMTHAEYLRQENDYRNLLRQAGVDVDVEYATPASMVGFFEGEIAPDELRDRLQIWNQVKQAGDRVREAFYVYAEMSPSDDDLFEAAVDPAREQQLYSAYNAKVAAQASGPNAWANWITRATQAGLGRVAKILTDAQKQGSTTGAAVQRVLEVDPAFARQIMDVIYHGGDPTPGMAGSLNLNELLNAFEFAAVGAAATEAGLTMPTKERLGEIRAAGVDRDKMISGYQAYGQNQGLINAAVERARGMTFGQEQFESGQFLGNTDAANALRAGQNYSEAAGKATGGFRFAENGNRLVQSGFTGY